MKRIILLFFPTCALVIISIQAVACSGTVPTVTIPTKTTAPIPTAVIQNYPDIIITATPIGNLPEKGEEIKKLVEKLYQVNPKCSIDILNTNDIKYEKPVLKFNISNIDPALMNYQILEIADNSSHFLRSFIACDLKKCQPKLYLKNLNNGVIKEIDWSTQIPYRPIGHVIWFGDNLLAFVHQNGPTLAVIAVINVSEEIFFSYWLTDNRCSF